MVVSRECQDQTDHLVRLALLVSLDLLDPEALPDPMVPLVRMVELEVMVLSDLLDTVVPLDISDLLVPPALLVFLDPQVPLVVDTTSLVDTMSTEPTSPLSGPRTTRWTPPSSP